MAQRAVKHERVPESPSLSKYQTGITLTRAAYRTPARIHIVFA